MPVAAAGQPALPHLPGLGKSSGAAGTPKARDGEEAWGSAGLPQALSPAAVKGKPQIHQAQGVRGARLPAPAEGAWPRRDALPEPSGAKPGSGGRAGRETCATQRGPPRKARHPFFFVLWGFRDFVWFGVFLLVSLVLLTFLLVCLFGGLERFCLSTAWFLCVNLLFFFGFGF